MIDIYSPGKGGLSLLLGLVMLCGVAFGQGSNRTGRVVAQTDGTAVPGANIAVKGTTRGVTTDAGGNFQINAGDNDVLVVSYIGFRAMEIKVGNRSTINVTLAEDISSLNEVVVTGYSSQSKRDITGAVSTVNTKDLLALPATNVAQQLQGRVAGVTVINDATPGGGATVRIRGFGTIGNNDPLYIVDGVPTQDINNINQNDIETFQVLKDATSASIYGARAGNGVVIITTKRGKAGPAKITIDAYTGTQTIAQKGEVLNSTELGQYIYQANVNAGRSTGHGQYKYGPNGAVILPAFVFPSGAAEGDPRANPSLYSLTPSNINAITRAANTNWFDEVTQTSPIRNVQVGAVGGSESGRYALSVGYFSQDGVIKHVGFERYSIRANTEFNVKKRVRIGENLTVAFNTRKGGFNNNEEQNAISGAFKHHPLLPVYDIAGNFAGSRGENLGNNSNPYATLFRDKDNRYNSLRMIGNAYAEVDLIQGMTVKTSIGIDANADRAKYLGKANPEYVEGNFINTLTDQNRYAYQWVWSNTLSYTKALGADHKIDAFVGTEAIKSYQEFFQASRQRFFNEQINIQSFLDLGTQSTAANEGRIERDFSLFSVFGKANYAFRDRYLFQAILRQDRSSRFLQATNSALFPSVSAGWRISDEAFMKSVPFINDLKLRVGWGQTGNQEIGDYNAYTTYGSSTFNSNYPITGSPTTADQGFDISNFGNPQAQWETTTSTNIGLDAALLNSHLNIEFDVWSRRTTGMLYRNPIPFSAGDAEPPFVNVGEMSNRGIDLGITYRNTALGNKLRYSASVNFSTYRNEVVDLNGGAGTVLLGYNSRVVGGAVNRSVVGLPLSSFYGYQINGIFQSAEEARAWPVNELSTGYNKAGKFRFVDVNGDNKITDADRTFIGNPHPDFTYGININVGYGPFDLTVFGNGSQGNDIYNYTRFFTDFNTFQGNRSRRSLYEAWSPTNTGGTVPIPDAADNVSNLPSTYFIEDGSYFRVRNIQLGYTLPQGLLSRIGLSNAQVYIQGLNLLTFTKYTGLNPEISISSNNDTRRRNQNLGFDGGYMPVSRTINAGLSVSF